MLNKILHTIWTLSLEKSWNWIWSKTEIDKKTIEIIDEIHVRAKLAREESKDVIDAIKGAPIKSKKRYYKPKQELKK